MTQAQVYQAAGFGLAVPRGTRPAVVVVDFSYGFTDVRYPTAADMSAQIAATSGQSASVIDRSTAPIARREDR